MIQTLCELGVAIHLLAVAVSANTYFVATSGSDSNAGDQVAPFRHVSKAADMAMQPGDVVVVMDGMYDNEAQTADSSGGGSVVIPRYSGAAGAPITFMALHRGKVVLDASSSVQSSTLPGCYGAWSYFDLRNVSYITIQGFVVKNACLAGIAANGTGRHDVVIKQNEFAYVGRNFAYPGSGGPQGIYVNSTESNFAIDSNIFHDIGGGTNINQQHGIYTAASNVTITNNIFYDNVHGWDIHTAGGTNLTIANNTFAFKNPHRDGHIIIWDGDKAGSLTNIVIANNIFYEPGVAAIVSALSGPVKGCHISNNLTTSGKMADIGSDCIQSNNTTYADPNLVNAIAAPYDFHLQPGSPAIGRGIRVPGVSTDFDGLSRPNSFESDIGAYAFVPRATRLIAWLTKRTTLLGASIAPGHIILSALGAATALVWWARSRATSRRQFL